MEPQPQILVVDDDREIRDLLARFLVKHGFRVETAADGKAMRAALQDRRIDLVVLDLMLPGEDGLTLCRDIRAGSDLPVIMLTAMGEEIDRIVGLEVGADDYLAKPFNPRELLARIRAVLRRAGAASRPGSTAPATVMRFAGWTLDPGARTLTDPAGMAVELTSGEFDLLLVFAERPQRVLSRDQLLDLTRGRDALPFDRSIDVQISRLRRKVEGRTVEGDSGRPELIKPELIKTVRSGGYVFTAAVTTGPADPRSPDLRPPDPRPIDPRET
jgi:two-component system, OmpR family, response regulator